MSGPDYLQFKSYMESQRLDIYHHGILGQKWGKKNGPPYPLQRGTHGEILNQSRDEDIKIKKGTTAYRVATNSDLNTRTKNGQLYVSFDKLDNLTYLSASASKDGGVAVDLTGNNGGKPYRLTLKVTNDLIAPSYEKTIESFVKTVDIMGGKKKFAQDLYGNETTKALGKQKIKEFMKNYGHLSVEECRDNAYMSFVKSFMKDSRAKEIFFNNLKQNGYNALVDENDKHFGKDGYTNAPFIVFDKDKSLKISESYQLNDKDVEFFRDLWVLGTDEVEYSKKRYGNTYNKWKKAGGGKLPQM